MDINFSITERLKSDLAEISRLRNITSSQPILPEAEAVIRRRATVESVHSSTSIEGNPLDRSQVRDVITNGAKLSRDEYAKIEVRNYKNALDLVTSRRGGDLRLSEKDILDIHRIITDGLLDKSRSGHYRKNQVFVEDGHGRTLYRAAETAEVRTEIAALLDYIYQNEFRIDPALLAGILHLLFVAIHPFADGNGRTARALTALFLALMNMDNSGTLELDSYYSEDRRSYYSAISRVCGKNYETARTADLTPWLEYFTAGFVSSLHVLHAEIRIMNMSLCGPAGRPLKEQDQDILGYTEQFGSVGISEAEAILPELDRRSVQRHLRSLVDAGFLETTGAGRETRYRIRRRKI